MITEEEKKTLAFAIYALANYDIPIGEFLERSLVCINDTLKQCQKLPIDIVVVPKGRFCGKNENKLEMCNCCNDNNCHDDFCKG